MLVKELVWLKKNEEKCLFFHFNVIHVPTAFTQTHSILPTHSPPLCKPKLNDSHSIMATTNYSISTSDQRRENTSVTITTLVAIFIIIYINSLFFSPFTPFSPFSTFRPNWV